MTKSLTEARPAKTGPIIDKLVDEQDLAKREQLAEELRNEEQAADAKLTEWLDDNLSEAISAALPLEHLGAYDLTQILANDGKLPLFTAKTNKWKKSNPYKAKSVTQTKSLVAHSE